MKAGSVEHVTRVAAYGLVLRAGRILLCRLASDFNVYPGAWTLPGGGVEFGEDPADAMVREVEEETGLTVRLLKIAGIDSFCDVQEKRAFHGIRILYYTEIIGGNLRNELHGSTDLCAWWTLQETAELPLVDLTEVGLRLAFPKS